MKFKLTEEEIKQIIENYGGTKRVIDEIEIILSNMKIILDKDDYIELIISVLSQYETMLEKLRNASTRVEKITAYTSLERIISYEIERKYENLEENSYEVVYDVKKRFTSK